MKRLVRDLLVVAVALTGSMPVHAPQGDGDRARLAAPAPPTHAKPVTNGASR